jgi:hypothetical protein
MSTRQINSLDVAGLTAFGDHLLGDRRAAFASTTAGHLYLGPIEAGLRAMQASPGGPAPAVAPASDEALKAHTDLGKAIWNGLAMVAAAPLFVAETRAAAMRVRDAFGARPLGARATATTRVQRAAVVRHAMEARSEDLAMLPPVAGDATFAAWIAQWCEAGSAFGDGLVEAAVAEARGTPARRPLRTIVGRLNGLIVRARRSLRDELDADPSLPRTLEAEVFGLYDRLIEEFRVRAAARRRRTASAGGPPPPGAAPATTDPVPADPTPVPV